MPPRPPFVLCATDVHEEESRYPGSEERLSSSRDLGRAAGLQRIGVYLERVAPGQRTSWPHAHEREEEFLYVLDGEVELWLDGELHPLRAGDFVGFAAGTGIAHTVLNDGEREAVLLVGGERSSPGAGDRLWYPHHPERRAQIGEARWWSDRPERPHGPHGGEPKR
jgi:uncharacterized cupin superfamily protein